MSSSLFLPRYPILQSAILHIDSRAPDSIALSLRSPFLLPASCFLLPASCYPACLIYLFPQTHLLKGLGTLWDGHAMHRQPYDPSARGGLLPIAAAALNETAV